MTFLGAMLSLLLPRSAWRVIQRRDRAGWRADHFLQNSEVRRRLRLPCVAPTSARRSDQQGTLVCLLHGADGVVVLCNCCFDEATSEEHPE